MDFNNTHPHIDLFPSPLRLFAGRLLWSALLLAATLCLGWADTWDGIRSAAENMDTMSADFVQEKHLPILVKPLVSTGKLFYRRPGSLRWEYTSPVKSILLMHAGDARRFVQSEKGWVEDASVRLQAVQFVMPQIAGWLGGQFQDNPMFDARLSAGNKILLVPKDEGMAKFIQRIELTMSDQPGVLESVMIYESENAFTRMIFEHAQINPSFDDRLFQDIK